MKSMKGKPNTGLKSDGSHFLMIGVYHTTRARRGRTTTTTTTTTTKTKRSKKSNNHVRDRKKSRH